MRVKNGPTIHQRDFVATVGNTASGATSLRVRVAGKCSTTAGAVNCPKQSTPPTIISSCFILLCQSEPAFPKAS